MPGQQGTSHFRPWTLAHSRSKKLGTLGRPEKVGLRELALTIPNLFVRPFLFFCILHWTVLHDTYIINKSDS
jgi:hypothetical protein